MTKETNIYRFQYQSRNKQGYALIGLLVVIVIIMILYFLDISAIFKPPRKVIPKAPQSRPWLQEDLLVTDDNKIIDLPESPKPELNEALTIEGFVTREGQDRGIILLDFDTHGRLNGTWQPSYVQGDRHIAFDSEFAGNIDIETTYINDGSEEPSYLYFFCKGKYTQTIFNTAAQKTSVNEGTVYATGYVRPDYSAFGWITITTDRSWSEVYEFQTSE